MKYITHLLAILFLVSFSATASDSHHEHKKEGSLDAHAHGLAKLEWIQVGDEIKAELEIPGENWVGFEHKAKSAEDKKKLSEAKAALKDQAKVFEFKSDCKLDEVEIETEYEGDHLEFHAEYEFDCKTKTKVEELKIKLFDHSKSLEKLTVVYSVFGKQGSSDVTRKKPTVKFK